MNQIKIPDFETEFVPQVLDRVSELISNNILNGKLHCTEGYISKVKEHYLLIDNNKKWNKL
jgi:hypothetical protein